MGSKSKKKNKTTASEDASTTSTGAGGGGRGGGVITDARFASVHSDPRFQRVPKHKSKVPIDSRFQSILTDKCFASSSAPLDKHGRPKKNDANSRNPLKHYYRIEDEKEEEEEVDGEE